MFGSTDEYKRRRRKRLRSRSAACLDSSRSPMPETSRPCTHLPENPLIGPASSATLDLQIASARLDTDGTVCSRKRSLLKRLDLRNVGPSSRMRPRVPGSFDALFSLHCCVPRLQNTQQCPREFSLQKRILSDSGNCGITLPG